MWVQVEFENVLYVQASIVLTSFHYNYLLITF